MVCPHFPLPYSSSGQRTRHFFNGLTEEVRKVSLGTHADDAFGFEDYADGTTTAGWTKTSGTGSSLASATDAVPLSLNSRTLTRGSTSGSLAADGTSPGGPFLSWVMAPGTLNISLSITTSAGQRGLGAQPLGARLSRVGTLRHRKAGVYRGRGGFVGNGDNDCSASEPELELGAPRISPRPHPRQSQPGRLRHRGDKRPRGRTVNQLAARSRRWLAFGASLLIAGVAFGPVYF